MIKRVIGAGLATIKANKVREKGVFSEEQINGCRELLKMGRPMIGDMQLNCKLYLRERIDHRIPRQSTLILQRWSQLNPLECQIGVLSRSDTFTARERSYVDAIVKSWSSYFLLNKRVGQQKGSDLVPVYKMALLDFMKRFNELVYLLTMDESAIIYYLNIYTLVRQFHLSADTFYSTLRYVFDALLQLPSLSVNGLSYLLFFTSHVNVHHFYYIREKEIMRFIYDRIAVPWEVENNKFLITNLVYNLSLYNDPPERIVKEVPKLLEGNAGLVIKFRAFVFMMEFFVIDKSNIRRPEYMKLIPQFVKEIPETALKILARLFYRTEIWISEFWLPYFQFVNQKKNYQMLLALDHYIIDDMIAEGEAGRQVKQRALQFRKHLLRQGLDLSKINLRDSYEKEFGHLMQQKTSIQQQVANSLRLICRAQVLTEVPVKYFLVDILLDKRIVIEINNPAHYKIINRRETLNLKSYFRERILTKMGYVYKNIKVEDFMFSNFNMLEDIYKIVESTNSLEVKTPRSVHTL